MKIRHHQSTLAGCRRRVCVTCLAAVGLVNTAAAAQVLEVRDADTAVVRISLRDQTRIRVLDGHVSDAWGDIYDPNTNPTGRLALTKDEADGELYVKPMPVVPPGGSVAAPTGAVNPPLGTAGFAPVKLDVKSDRGAVALLLQPADIVGETLSLRITGAANKPAGVTSAAFAEQADTHERAIKALTLAMANPALSGTVPGRDVAGGPRPVALWQEARFVLSRTVEVAGLVGETYELTNTSPQRMVIDERELYRPGVLSVALRRLVLEPGDTTPVWVVRTAASQD